MSLYIQDKDSSLPYTLSTLHLRLRNLLDANGEPYDLSGCSKFYAHIKDALTDADSAADAKIDSSTNPTQFITTYASTGNLDVIFSTTNTNLTAGTQYYVSVAALWSTGVKVILLQDTIKFQTPATLSVT